MVSIWSWNFSFRFMFTLGHNMKSTSCYNFQPGSLETSGWRVKSVTELNEGDPPAAFRCPQLLHGPLQGQMLPCFQIALSHPGQLLNPKLPFWNSHIKPWHQRTEVFTTPWRHYVSQSRDFALLSSRVRLEAEAPAQPVSTCQGSTHLSSPWTSPVVQTVKRLPTMQRTWVQSLGQEGLLEKEVATLSSILAWKIPWMEEPGRLQSTELKRVRHDWATLLFKPYLECPFHEVFHYAICLLSPSALFCLLIF